MLNDDELKIGCWEILFNRNGIIYFNMFGIFSFHPNPADIGS